MIISVQTGSIHTVERFNLHDFKPLQTPYINIAVQWK